MKIAYLLGSLNRGGTETLLLDVFRNAEKAQFDFMGIHRKGGAYKTEFYSTRPKFMQCAMHGKRIVNYLFRLRRLLMEEGVTVVHAQQSIDALYAKLATWGTPVRVVQTFHGYDFNTTRWEKLLIALTIRCCDAVCFVSNTQKEYYIRQYGLTCPKKLYTVYNGVNFDKLDETPQPVDFLEKIDPAPRGKMKLAMVGNFVRVRAQSSLCQFLHLLHQEEIPFDFFFVGKKDEKEPWRYDDCLAFCKQHGLQKQVHFVGSRKDVPQILQQIDAFVYASDHDTFGIAVVEAIAAGVPTFVNDWDVMREITHDGEWAMLYRTNAPHDLLRVFLDYVKNRDIVKQKAKKNASHVRECYSIQQHLRQLYHVYCQL